MGLIKWNSWWGYRHVCAIAAAGNILMMMVANLIGFCVGLDGIVDLLKGIVESYYGMILLQVDCRMGFCGGGVWGIVRWGAGHV
jgi:D-alanyl-lipoteichoic acid acyltransferase DltB (MBOAT superfamily)